MNDPDHDHIFGVPFDLFVCLVFVDDTVLIVVVVTVAGFFSYNLIWTLKRFVHFKGGKVFIKQCFWLQDMDKIFLDLSCAEGTHRGIGDSLLNSKILTEDSYQDCTPKAPKETSYFFSWTPKLSHVGDNKDVVDGAVVEMEEPLLTSGVDGLSKPSYPVLGEGLNLSNYIELLILCNVQTK